MPQGDVRINPETGEVYRLERPGNDLEWVQLEGEEAYAAQRAAETGPLAAFAVGAADSVMFGMLPDSPMTEALRANFPQSTLAGELSPLGPGIAALGRSGLSRLTARQIRSAGQAQGQLIRRPSDILGRATLGGSAARIGEATLDAIPGLNLPGMLQKAINQRRLNMAFARAIGLSDEAAAAARTGVTPNFIDEALTNLNQKFRQVETALDGKLDQVAARTALDEANEAGFLGTKLKNVLAKSEPIEGKEIMALRSELNAVIGSNESFLVKKQAIEIMENIDNNIATALQETGENLMELFAETRAQWRVWANVRTGRGLSPDGQVNARTVTGRLANNYGDAFRRGDFKTASGDVDNFLKIAQEAASLDVGLPSSGTAERAVGAAVLGGGFMATQ